jgi:cytoskeletal protein RodZ
MGIEKGKNHQRILLGIIAVVIIGISAFAASDYLLSMDNVTPSSNNASTATPTSPPTPTSTPKPTPKAQQTTGPQSTQTPDKSTQTPTTTATPTQITPSPTPTITPTPPPITPTTWSDNQISIDLNKVEKTNTIPSNVASFMSGIAAPPDLKPNMDYVFVNLTVSRITNVHLLGISGFGNQSTNLISDAGNSYNCSISVTKGIQYSNPNDFHSPSEIAVGAKNLIIFEMPKQEIPKTLSLIYTFKDTWEGAEKEGQLIIGL